LGVPRRPDPASTSPPNAPPASGAGRSSSRPVRPAASRHSLKS
jgi:hypothetical protein